MDILNNALVRQTINIVAKGRPEVSLILAVIDTFKTNNHSIEKNIAQLIQWLNISVEQMTRELSKLEISSALKLELEIKLYERLKIMQEILEGKPWNK